MAVTITGGWTLVDAINASGDFSAPNLNNSANLSLISASGLSDTAFWSTTSAGTAYYFWPKTNPGSFSAQINGIKLAYSVDLTAGTDRLFVIHVNFFSPAQTVMETTASSGLIVSLLDGTPGNYKRWIAGGKNNNFLTWGNYNPIVIDPSTTATYATSGTLNRAAIVSAEIHISKVSGQEGDNRACYLNRIGYVEPWVMTGSTGTFADFFNDAWATDFTWLIRKQGANQYIVTGRLEVGNASTATTFTDSNIAIEFPGNPDTANGISQTHVSDNKMGFRVNGGASDVVSITGYSFFSAKPYKFQIQTTAGGSCTLTRVVVSGAGTIEFQAQATLTGVICSNCGQIDLRDMPTINALTVSATAAAYATKMSNGLTMENVAFTALGASDYAIEMTTAGDYTLDTVTFSGYATGKKVYVSATSGTVNINPAGGTLISSGDITSAGATVNVVSSDTWNIIIPGAVGTRYRVVDSVDGEIYNSTIASGTSVTLTTTTLTAGRTMTVTTTYQSTTTVKWGGPWAAIVPSGGGDIDFTANTPETISEFATWGIDGSTVTECSSDYGNIEVEISSGASTLDRRRIIAFIAYAMTSADGIRNWFGLLNILDAANVVVDEDIADLHFVNVGAVDVVLTTLTVWIRREDGAALLESGTKSLTMEVSPVYTISAGGGLTPSESAQLMAIPTNPITTGATVDANIVEVNSVAVSGAGTEADPWGP